MMSSDESDSLIFGEATLSTHESILRDIKSINSRSQPSRWFMLFLVSAVALINGIQNLQFAGCESQIVSYFKVSFILGDLLTQAYYISFVALAFPVIWLIMKKGLRFSLICAAGLTIGSAALTTISIVNNKLFPIALLGEFLAGIAQVFVLCLPSLLAGQWFSTSEVSLASGIVVFTYELGNGMSMLVPPLVVAEEKSNATIGAGAVYMFGGVAVFSFVIFLLVCLCFSENLHRISTSFPPGQTSYCKSLRNLMTNSNFILLFFSYGVDFGLFSTMESIYKAVLAKNFPVLTEFTTGQMVAVMILAGTPAPLIFGAVLDRTKKFIRTLFCIHGICIVSATLLVFAMKSQRLWLVWIAIALLGFGLTGKMSVGLETAAEITYPEPEGTSSGLLMWSMSVFTVIFIQVTRYLLLSSTLYVNVFILSGSILASVFTCFMKSDLRRTRANYEVIEEDTDEKQ